VATGQPGVHLGEGAEQAGQLVGRDADPGIDDVDAHRGARLREPERHAATVGELHALPSRLTMIWRAFSMSLDIRTAVDGA
jgi:hypothetical protein